VRRLLALLPLLAACSVGPDYAPAPPQTPPAFSAGEGAAPALGRWWTVFKDPVLDRLVDEALRSAPDLRVADARVRRAFAASDVQDSAFWPTVQAEGTASRLRRSENGVEFPVDLYRTYFTAGFRASWEIDLFGGTRRASEAAEADAQAAVMDRETAQVSLLGELGAAYVGLRGAQGVLRAIRDAAATARDTAALTRARLDAGVATALDLSRAEAQAALAEALVPPAEAEVRRSMHRAAVLLGRDPGALRGDLEAAGPVPSAPPGVVVGLPSELLLRRPDLRATERRLAAATARVGQALGEYFPKLSLTGAFGLESLESADLLQAASRAWSIGPAIRWPVFAGGRLRAGVRAAEAGVDEAAALHERAVLRALEEVENALVAVLREGERRARLAASVEASRRASGLAGDLHRQGLASFLEVLEAQRVQFAAERDLASSEAAAALSLVALYRALGGGWEAPGR
jgi:NodT family efflux transporter outer membrane factor (OMF) lipoprotein